MKKFKIPKNFFKDLECELSVPTVKCMVCGGDILDTPTNRLLYTDWLK